MIWQPAMLVDEMNCLAVWCNPKMAFGKQFVADLSASIYFSVSSTVKVDTTTLSNKYLQCFDGRKFHCVSFVRYLRHYHDNFAITRFDNPFERLLVSLPTLNQFGQTRSLGASAPRDLSFAYSGILIPIV
jgi:hypothetical protein